MSKKAEAVTNKIIAVAQSLLSDFGESFTMEQLEAKSNVSRATIYRRVGGKDALLQKLAEARGEVYQKADMRLNILKAARNVFGREGLAAATMEQIAIDANVGVATVYRHFGDKQTLMRAFIGEMTPFVTVREIALRPTENIAADLEEIAKAMLAFFFENRDIFRLIFMGSHTERNYLKELRGRSGSSLRTVANYFQSQIDAGRIERVGDANELALSLMGIILAFAVIGPMHYGTKLNNVDGAAKMISNLLLTGLQGAE